MIRTLVAALALCGLLRPVRGFVAAQDAAVTSSADATTYQLSGVVIDSARVPVPEAEGTLIEAGVVSRRGVTDPSGRFTLRGGPATRLTGHVRSLGYRQQTLGVLPGADRERAVGAVILAGGRAADSRRGTGRGRPALRHRRDRVLPVVRRDPGAVHGSLESAVRAHPGLDQE